MGKGFLKTELDGEASCQMTKIGVKMSKENKRRGDFHLPSDASKSATASHTTICRPLAT